MLVDTNILAILLQPQHALYVVADLAIERLISQGRELHILPQNLIELWVVLTRPIEQNGLGLQPAAAAVELDRIKNMFILLPETSAIYPAWEALVTRHAVSGKPTHDARLVAGMQVHGLSSVLTFDESGFKRFSDIEAVNPAHVRPVEAPGEEKSSLESEA